MPKKVIFAKSDREGKKMKAIFYLHTGGPKIKTVHFGQEGASDFTKNKDEDRKKAYLDRHRKNENWDDPMTAGALSRWILWNKPTLQASIDDYRKRFNLV